MQTNITLLILFFPLLLAAGVVYQWIAGRRDSLRFPAPGKLIDVGGSALHLHCTGEGSPVVVLESGIAASSVSWVHIQRELSKDTRVCSYDRAGLAWSAPSRKPRAGAQMVDDLRTLLAGAGVPGPYILVGHSFGGLLARIYAAKYPHEVAGMVLLDPALTGEWAAPTSSSTRMLGRGVALSRRGAWLARIGFVRLSLAMLSGGRHTLPKLMAKLSSGKGSSVPERLIGEVRKLPPEVWPAVQSHWCRPEAFISMSEHLAALPGVAAEAQACRAAGTMPVAVISAANLTPEQLAEHRKIGGVHIIAEGSGHWVQLDRPDIVLATILEIVQRLAR